MDDVVYNGFFKSDCTVHPETAYTSQGVALSILHVLGPYRIIGPIQFLRSLERKE